MDEDILKGKTLLVVDDEADLRDIVASELDYMGAKVFQAENIAVAQSYLKENSIDLVVSDIRMPGGTGIDLLNVIKTKNVEMPPVILITGFADITLADALNKGAEALINKPFKLDDLIKLVVRHTSSYRERFQNSEEGVKTLNQEAILNFKSGRGGVALEVLVGAEKIEAGDLINFNLKVDTTYIKGVGECRWIKNIEHDNRRIHLGIEFLQLDDESLNHFQKLNEGKNIIPYIPVFN